MARRVYYTWYEIVIAWFKKLLGIKSPSAMMITQGRYEYEYDFIMKVEHKYIGKGRTTTNGNTLRNYDTA